MRTALDLMTPNLKTVASGDTLEDIIKLFLEQGITSSPVKNPLGETLGVFTELSLLKAFMLHKAKFGKSQAQLKKTLLSLRLSKYLLFFCQLF